MAQQAELTSAPPAAVTVFINYRVRVMANRAEQFTRAEDGFPQVLAHLGFSWYLIEFVHVHNFTSFLWTVPSGLDYPLFLLALAKHKWYNEARCKIERK